MCRLEDDARCALTNLSFDPISAPQRAPDKGTGDRVSRTFGWRWVNRGRFTHRCGRSSKLSYEFVRRGRLLFRRVGEGSEHDVHDRSQPGLAPENGGAFALVFARGAWFRDQHVE